MVAATDGDEGEVVLLVLLVLWLRVLCEDIDGDLSKGGLSVRQIKLMTSMLVALGTFLLPLSHVAAGVE